MSKHRRVALGCAAVLGGAVLGVVPLASPSYAAVTDADAATALDLPAGVSAAVSGSAVVSTKTFNDFPSQGSSYLTLSTGDASKVFSSVAGDQLSGDNGTDGVPDTSSVTLTVAPSTGAQCLVVDFAMGTEEPVHTYTATTPSDTLSVQRQGDATEYAMNTGAAYFSQDGWDPDPQPYQVNAIGYWHRPGDATDSAPGSYDPLSSEPRLSSATGINDFTSRDSARVPLDLSGGAQTVTVSVRDANNSDLDSVATVDHVRLLPIGCYAGTGVEPNASNNGGVIGGIKRIGQQLYYDPVPSTSTIEGSGDVANQWHSPSGGEVELRYRWFWALSTYDHNGDMGHWHAIQDADRQSYVPVEADRGHVLIVFVTGFVDGRLPLTVPSTGTAATWYVTTPIGNGTFASGTAPTIQGPDGGAATVGDTLTAQIEDTYPRQDSWAWQWYADGSPVSGATTKSLVVDAAQAGKKITVKATAKRNNYDDKAWSSDPYGPVLYRTWTSTPAPTIVDDGTPTVGETVTADPGVWSPTPTSYSYQWKRNGAVIAGATHASYALVAADAGAQLTVMVSGVSPGFLQDPQPSDPVGILGATQTGATPTVSGTAQVGQTLTGTVVGWSPTGATLTYTWYAGTTVLKTGSRYLVVPAAAVGKPVTLHVTGTRTGYSPLTMTSQPTAPVARGTLKSAVPRVVGTAKVGQTLYASKGVWGPYGVQVTYQWKVGGRAVNTAAGRKYTFKIPRTARGKRITVSVTGRLAGYTTVTRTSAATKRVVR